MSLTTQLLADAVKKGGPGSGPQGGKQDHSVRGALKDKLSPEHAALASKISSEGHVGDLTDYLASHMKGGLNSEKMRDHLDSKGLGGRVNISATAHVMHTLLTSGGMKRFQSFKGY